ncbi:MAG: hypothetical protein LBH86_00855 [Oscillospiraceae bacterium]|nr:hypothetical protein [Oscillospiraceae bacterium]
MKVEEHCGGGAHADHVMYISGDHHATAGTRRARRPKRPARGLLCRKQQRCHDH